MTAPQSIPLSGAVAVGRPCSRLGALGRPDTVHERRESFLQQHPPVGRRAVLFLMVIHLWGTYWMAAWPARRARLRVTGAATSWSPSRAHYEWTTFNFYGTLGVGGPASYSPAWTAPRPATQRATTATSSPSTPAPTRALKRLLGGDDPRGHARTAAGNGRGQDRARRSGRGRQLDERDHDSQLQAH
jgi:hypothetical protein